MQLLADVSRLTLGTAASDDATSLGPIRNPYVRRRERRNAAPKAAVAATEPAKPKPAPVKTAPSKPAPAEKIKEETESKPSSKESTPTPSGTKKPAPKRGASGGIMQSFAKAASMPKKTSQSKPAAAAAEADIQALALSDDGEDDSLAMPEPQEETEAARKNRKDRQDALKRMMEESSEDEEPEKEDTPMEDAEEEPPAPEPEAKEDIAPAEVISSTGDGRRRGKRQVMKKKTVMDEQGYLGMSCLLHNFECLANIWLQSLYKKKDGNLSQRTSPPSHQRRKSRQGRNRRSPKRQLPKARETSCLSSARNSNSTSLIILGQSRAQQLQACTTVYSFDEV